MTKYIFASFVLMFAVANGFGQTRVPAEKGKTKGLKVPGISDLFPLGDKKRQMKWYVKWMVRDKLDDWYMRQFMALVKEEQVPWKKALDREQFSKKPRDRYIEYYKSHVDWYDKLHACVEGLVNNKSAMLPIKDSVQPLYVKKRTELLENNKELIKEFRKIITSKPKTRTAKKG